MFFSSADLVSASPGRRLRLNPDRPRTGPASLQPPRLLDRVRQAIRARHYTRRYIFFHNKRHPLEMGAAEVTAFLTWLAVHGKVAASTQNQALSALLFLYREVQDIDFGANQLTIRSGESDKDRVTMLPAAVTGDLAAHLDRVHEQHRG